MNEKKLKHLEFIQAVITRLATNSFLIKGWSVTLVAAIFALAAKDAKPVFALVTYLPVVSFWVLDAFFLSHERKYRELFETVAAKDESAVDFSMATSHFKKKNLTVPSCAFSSTIFAFHGTLILAVTAMMIFLVKRG